MRGGEKTSSADGFENHPSPEMIHVSFSHIWEAKSNYHSICSGQARITETVFKKETPFGLNYKHSSTEISYFCQI